MKLLDSLLDAIVRLEGDALVMHVGEKPYVVTASSSMNAYRGPLAWGQVELSSRVLTFDAVSSMLVQILPAHQQQALTEFGAIEHEIPSPVGIADRFTVVAARGGEDVWLEVRRKPLEIPEAAAEATEQTAPAEPPSEGVVTAPGNGHDPSLASAAPQPMVAENVAAAPAEPPVALETEPATESDAQEFEIISDAEVEQPAADAPLQTMESIVVAIPGQAAEEIALNAVPDNAIQVIDDEAQDLPTEEEVDAMLAATATSLLTSSLGGDAAEGESFEVDVHSRAPVPPQHEDAASVVGTESDDVELMPFEPAFELSPPTAVARVDDESEADIEAIGEAPAGTPLFSAEAALAAAAPVHDVAVAEAPVAEVPVAEMPVAEMPVGEIPVGEIPVEEAPVIFEAPPVADVTATELPMVATEPLVEHVAIVETWPVADQAPAAEAWQPVEAPPVFDTWQVADQPPVSETWPIDEQPTAAEGWQVPEPAPIADTWHVDPPVIAEPSTVSEQAPMAESWPAADQAPLAEPWPAADQTPPVSSWPADPTPIAESWHVPEPLSTVDPVPAAEQTPAVEPWPADDQAPIAAMEPVAAIEPVIAMEPVVAMEPEAAMEPIAEQPPVAEPWHVAEHPPIAELWPVSELPSSVEPWPIADEAPLSTSWHVSEPLSVVDPVPAAEQVPAVEPWPSDGQAPIAALESGASTEAISDHPPIDEASPAPDHRALVEIWVELEDAPVAHVPVAAETPIAVEPLFGQSPVETENVTADEPVFEHASAREPDEIVQNVAETRADAAPMNTSNDSAGQTVSEPTPRDWTPPSAEIPMEVTPDLGQQVPADELAAGAVASTVMPSPEFSAPMHAEAHAEAEDDLRQAVVVPLARTPIKPEIVSVPFTPSEDAALMHTLRVAAARGASTVYVVAQSKPMIRIDGEIGPLESEPTLTAADVDRLVMELAPPRRRDALQNGPVEWLCDVPEIGRVRCLTFKDHRGPGILFRMFPPRAISADQLGLTPEVQALCQQSDGLVLVTGARASGKSTLLNAFVDLINRTRSDHVITIESQIGFVHESRRSFISQRESRGDAELAASFARAALREDPDVMMIEDLKSPELVSAALEAAESGRLVLASVPASSTIAALERLIEVFPADRRAKARTSLATALRGVVAQVLLRRVKGGRVAAREILLNTPAVSTLVLEGKMFQLPVALDSGRRHGMVPLTDSLAAQVRDGTVHVGEAYRKALDRAALVALLKREGIDTSFAERLA